MSGESELLQKLQKIRQNSGNSESDSDELDKSTSSKEEQKIQDTASIYEESVERENEIRDDSENIKRVKMEEPVYEKSSIPRDIFYINDKTGCLQIFRTFDELSEYLVQASSSNTKQDDTENDDEIISTVLSIPLGSMVHHVTMGKYLRHLYEKDRLMDVNVEVGTEVFKAHRIALSCYSRYFADLFASSKTEKYPVNVRIIGISEQSFAAFLEYVYTGESTITPEIATDFLVMAEYLKVPGLRKKYNTIIDSLPVENLTKILVKNKDSHVFRVALERLILDFQAISTQEGLLNIDVDLLSFLLESDNLHVDSEYDVYMFVIRWIAHNLEDRTKYALRLIGLIRFTCMSQQELFSCSETTGLVRGYDKFREYLLTSNWVKTADQLKRDDQFGFQRHEPRHSYRDRLIESGFRSQTDSKMAERSSDNVAGRIPMPPPLLASSPKPPKVQKYAKPVMVPADMQTSQESYPLTVDILVVGGFLVEPADRTERFVERYDIEDNQWVYYCKLQEPRRHHAVVTLAGKLYLIGGCHPENHNEPTKSVFVMDLTSKQWSQVTDMQEARQQHCACVLNGKIYVIGGMGNEERVLETVECYSPDTDTWTHVAPLQIAVYAAGAVVLNDKIYLAGGITNAREPFSKQDISPCVCSYDPLRNSWSYHNDMRFPRCRAEMVNVGDRLFLCGGATLSCTRNASRLISLSSIDEYIEKHDMWCHLTDLIIPRHDTGIAVAGDRIYIVGGVSTTADRVLQSIECYDTHRNTWLSGVQDLPYPTKWLKCATVVSKWQRGRRNSQ